MNKNNLYKPLLEISELQGACKLLDLSTVKLLWTTPALTTQDEIYHDKGNEARLAGVCAKHQASNNRSQAFWRVGNSWRNEPFAEKNSAGRFRLIKFSKGDFICGCAKKNETKARVTTWMLKFCEIQ